MEKFVDKVYDKMQLVICPYPFYVLLDKQGKILVYLGNEEDIDKKLEEIFGG